MLFLLNQTWGNVYSVCVRLFQICHNILICSFLQFLFRSKEVVCFSSSFSFCPSFFRLCSSEIFLTEQRKILFLNILNKNYCGFIAIELVTDNCWISRSNKYNPPRSSPIKLILSKIVFACASSSICSATYHCKKLCVE